MTSNRARVLRLADDSRSPVAAMEKQAIALMDEIDSLDQVRTPAPVRAPAHAPAART